MLLLLAARITGLVALTVGVVAFRVAASTITYYLTPAEPEEDQP